ncbi:MAG: ABC transporter substrate-binding protein [Dehalococcoidia bacterium]
MLHRLVGLIGVGLLVAACAPTAPAPTTQTGGQAPASTEKRAASQVLRIAQIGLPATMSPEASASNAPLYGAMYDALVWIDGKNNVLPWAAEKWTQVNPTTWRFNLRRDMTFSNGDKLTAADVEFTLNSIVENRWPQISLLTNLTGAKMVDDYTVDVMTKQLDASIVPGLIAGWIVPKNYYTSVSKNGFAAKPVGSGPYELVEFRANDIATFKKRSTEHPFRKVVATDLTIRSITEQTQMATGLRTGDLDAVVGLLRPDVVEQIARTDAKVEYKTVTNVSALISQPEMAMRNTPLQDKRVRWALNYAVDKEAMAKTLFKGYALAAGQLSAPNSPGWDESIKPTPYDPAMAKKLLAEAGYPNGFKLPIGIEFTPQTVDPNIALAIQSNLKDVGIDAPVTPYELAAFLDKYYGRNGQVKGDLFIQATSDGNGFMTHAQGLYSCALVLDWWCSEEFDRNMALANGEPDIAKRGVLMKKAVRAFYDDVSHINLLISSTFRVTGPKMRAGVWENSSAYLWDEAYKVE